MQKNIILKYLREADELLERGDVVQASEKYYKAAEEAIKFLTTIKGLEIILSQVRKKKRWSSELLFEAARLLNLLDLWKSAWKLHQDGFHEMVLEYNHVKIYSFKVKKLLEYIQHE